jgi:hypothetical protein
MSQEKKKGEGINTYPMSTYPLRMERINGMPDHRGLRRFEARFILLQNNTTLPAHLS